MHKLFAIALVVVNRTIVLISCLSFMKSHFFYSETIINRPINEVFDFFSKAENLNRLTPDELEFKILTPLPLQMRKGALIDYQIRLSKIPFKWKTEITVWNPPFSFIDRQVKGPYRIWIHEHSFLDNGNQTKMIDRVEFLSPGGILEPIINKAFVESRVKEIFSYREKRLKEIFV